MDAIIPLLLLKTMKKARLPKPRFGEITVEELEQHLVEDCGLTVIDLTDLGELPGPSDDDLLEIERGADKFDLLSTLNDPLSESAYYDEVLVCSTDVKLAAELHFRRVCKSRGLEMCSDVFEAGGKFCVRVRKLK